MSRPPLLLAAFVLLLAADQLSAQIGAWSKPAEGYYFGVSFASTTADHEYGFLGEERPLFRDTARFANGTMGISNVSIYGEYGFTDRLTGILSTYYTVAVREADIIERGSEGLVESASASGLGETRIGLRYALPGLPEGLAAAFNGLWKIPTGSANKEIPLGTGRPDFELGLGLGTGFGPIAERYAWVQGSAAFRIRSGRDNELPWSFELGLPVAKTFVLHALIDGTHSFADFEQAAGRSDPDATFIPLVGSQSFVRATGGLFYDLNEWTTLSVRYGATLSGRNSLASSTIGAGVAWTFDGVAE